MGTKIKTFIALIEEDKTLEEAMAGSGASKITAKIQYNKWKKSKGMTTPKKEVKEEVEPEEEEEVEETTLEEVEE
jgi:hypothetical protein